MDKWGKRIGIVLPTIFVTFFVYKTFERTELSPTVIWGLNVPPMLDSILLTVFGFGFASTALLYAIRAWSKTPDEYYAWRESYFGAARLKKSSRLFGRDYPHLNDRIVAPPAFLVGVLLLLYGLFSLTMNVLLALGLAPN